MARLRLSIACAACVAGGTMLGGELHAAPPPATRCPAAECGTIQGRARVAGERQPIPEASLMVVPAPNDARVTRSRSTSLAPPVDPPWSLAAAADDQGRFTLHDVPVGRVRLLVVAPGYTLTDRIVDVGADQTTTVDLFAEQQQNNPYRTVVQAAYS